MQRIYIVTSGSYSDYGICAVFSKKENAERYLKELNKTNYDEGRIEEWNMDDPDNDELVSKNGYRAYIYLQNSNLEVGRSHPMLVKKNANSQIYEGYNYVSVYSFISQEHAEKIAIEKRQEYLRKKVNS